MKCWTIQCLRRRWARPLLLALAVTLVAHNHPRPAVAVDDTGAPWSVLEPGLELGTFPSPQPAEKGDSVVRILRIDPNRFALRLLNASAAANGKPLTAKGWCRQHGLLAAINASMYQTDYRTSVSLMRTTGHTNNPRLSKDQTILAFDRQDVDVPPVKIIDRQCDKLDAWKHKYATLVQSIRMISCKGTNVWSQQDKKWSTAAIGVDRSGNVLFIHVRSPYSTHDLINILIDLPIELTNAMYVEGGPEAQLYVTSGDAEHEFVGSIDTGFIRNDAGAAWPIPNVVGVVRRSEH